MPQEGTPTRRYNLALPGDLYDELQKLAEKNGTSIVEMLRRFIRLGLLAARLQEDPNSALLIRDGDTETRVLLL